MLARSESVKEGFLVYSLNFTSLTATELDKAKAGKGKSRCKLKYIVKILRPFFFRSIACQ